MTRIVDVMDVVGRSVEMTGWLIFSSSRWCEEVLNEIDVDYLFNVVKQNTQESGSLKK